jgi:hypothetical protein
MEAKPEVGIEGASTNVAPTPAPTDAHPPTEPKKKKKNNGWTPEQEDLMANWSDIASCYRLLHDKTEKRYNKFNMAMTIPVIMLSTMTGTANFGMGSLFGNDTGSQRFANLAIGGVSLIAGLMTTLGNFLRFAQNMEAHRVAAVAWGKFQRQIAVELALHPNERHDSMDFIKIQRNELDRLIEQSPPIPEKVISKFEKQFKSTAIKKPDICNHLERTSIYKMKTAVVEATTPNSLEEIPPLIHPVGSAASRIQSFIVKARNGAPESPKNILDVTGIYGDDNV